MSSNKALVWGPLVRIGHWALALAVLVAVLTAGRPLDLHSQTGYLILAYVVGRVVWGVLGPPRARFWLEIGGPAAVLADLRATIARKVERPQGLGPVGALIVTATLASLAFAGLSGIALLAVREGQGPLAPILGGLYVAPRNEAQVRVDIPPTDPEIGGTTIVSRTDRVPSHPTVGEHPDIRSGGALRGVHGLFSTLTLWLAALHLAWVVVQSAVRGENLILSMVTGMRHVAPPMPPSLAAAVKAAPRVTDGTSGASGTRGSGRAAEKAARRAARQAERRGKRRAGENG